MRKISLIVAQSQNNSLNTQISVFMWYLFGYQKTSLGLDVQISSLHLLSLDLNVVATQAISLNAGSGGNFLLKLNLHCANTLTYTVAHKLEIHWNYTGNTLKIHWKYTVQSACTLHTVHHAHALLSWIAIPQLAFKSPQVAAAEGKYFWHVLTSPLSDVYQFADFLGNNATLHS